MYILGFSCYTHDSAAALLKDGRLIGAAEEERFTRRKHEHEFPVHAIRHLLDAAGITWCEVDHVAYHFRPWRGYPAMWSHFFKGLPRTLHLFRDRWDAMRDSSGDIYRHLGSPSATLRANHRLHGMFPESRACRFHFVEHHVCHHASAFLLSPFDSAASLSVDGCGDWVTTMTAHGRGTEIDVLDRVYAPHSLGMLYSAIGQYLGFSLLSGPGKVMGLAGHGRPERYYSALRDIVQLRDDGTFRLDFTCLRFDIALAGPRWAPRLEERIGPAREPAGALEQRHSDIAAALQQVLEETCFHILTELRERTGERRLCLSGGVALNSVMNGKVLEKKLFDELFIQPAAGDAGAAIGAACYVHGSLPGSLRTPEPMSPYVGASFDDAAIGEALKAAGLDAVRIDEPAETAAELLAGGKIIGWFQGAAEIGPRALGNRSILAAPFPESMRDVLNARVKHREGFRPFAPAVLEERCPDYFDGAAVSPFMLLVSDVRESRRADIPAVTHVDGTARVQTVSREQNELFYELIAAFGRRTGVPVVLNTSFNVRGMPIVNSPVDAIECFRGTELDALVMGSWVVRK